MISGKSDSRKSVIPKALEKKDNFERLTYEKLGNVAAGASILLCSTRDFLNIAQQLNCENFNFHMNLESKDESSNSPCPFCLLNCLINFFFLEDSGSDWM